MYQNRTDRRQDFRIQTAARSRRATVAARSQIRIARAAYAFIIAALLAGLNHIAPGSLAGLADLARAALPAAAAALADLAALAGF